MVRVEKSYEYFDIETPFSATRWSSRIDAINPLRFQAGEVYDALLELSTDSRSDAFGKNSALCYCVWQKAKEF